MKKRCLCFLVVLLCIAALCLMPSAFAAMGETEITRIDEGDKVCFSVNLLPDSEVEAVELVFSYKTEKLKYVGVQKGPLGKADNTIMMSNHVENEKAIYIAYASVNNQSKGGTILNILFKKNPESGAEEYDDSETVAGVKINSLVNGNGEKIADAQIYGDASVGLLTEDENINNVTNDIVPLIASGQEIDSNLIGIDKNAQLEKNLGEESVKSTINNMLWKYIIAAVVVIALIIFVVAIIVRKHKKRSNEYDNIQLKNKK